jgi:putative glutamine amidotransferase
MESPKAFSSCLPFKLTYFAMVMNNPIIGITTDIAVEYFRVKHHYVDAILRSGGVPMLLAPSDNPKIYAEKIDGLLIPGGDDLDPSYYNEEKLPWVKLVSKEKSGFEIALLKELVKLRKPILGICYGMQLINVAFGGTLYQDIEAQLKVVINHKMDYHIIVITENRFLREGRFSVNSTHHQAIKEPGRSLSVIARSTDNLIEAFCHEDYPFLIGIQWHPERRLEEELSLGIFDSFVKAADVGE